MFLQILLGAIIILVISGLILAIKYYKKKRWPLCSAVGRNFNKHHNCIVCGAEAVEDCTKTKSD